MDNLAVVYGIVLPISYRAAAVPSRLEGDLYLALNLSQRLPDRLSVS